MNLKTFVILFLMGISCSCSMTFEKNIPADSDEEDRSYETGTFNK